MIPNPLTSGPWYEVIWRRLTPTLLVLAYSAGTPTLAKENLIISAAGAISAVELTDGGR
jgi:hypothetical protein